MDDGREGREDRGFDDAARPPAAGGRRNVGAHPNRGRPIDSEAVIQARGGRASLSSAPATVALIAVMAAIEIYLSLGWIATALREAVGVDLQTALSPTLRLEWFRSYGFRPIELYAFLNDAAPISALSGLGTYMFLHGGFVHILFNCLAFLSFGAIVEKRIGPFVMLLLFVATGVAGGLAHGALEIARFCSDEGLCARQTAISLVGASGAVCGVIGFEFVLRSRLMSVLDSRGPAAGRAFLLRASLVFVGINAAIELVPGLPISGAAHIGGFLLGILIALVFEAGSGRSRTRRI